MDGITDVPAPGNEPVLSYAPGSPERLAVEARLKAMEAEQVELTATIGGEQRPGGGDEIPVVEPHRHAHVLGVICNATAADARSAVDAALRAAPGWRGLPFDERAAVFLKAAELAAGPWRQTLNAATMLGQSKTIAQAEIDAACELIDFWRHNVWFGHQILADQPLRHAPGVWNRLDHRPLEGVVYAVTPFNFTAIAGNLPSAPALMGNVVIWKPAPTQTLAAWHTLRLLEAAGLPPGVINLLPGDGMAVSDVVLSHPELAGIHFTGSTATFEHLWRTVGTAIGRYRSYPRLVGETGGKDFVVAHPSADPDALRTILVRGAFEYQGQKCSAASRAYLPASLWRAMGDDLVAETESLPMGDVADLANFMGAVIDRRAFAKHATALERAHGTASITVLAGGTCDDTTGYFVRPTILGCSDPGDEVFRTEYFGPILAVHVYEDGRFEQVVDQMEGIAPYALTGSLVARDRRAITWASERLRFAAGNFYVNDKPTGAVVGQQPFGGGRRSGTNDKAGSFQNLLRWTSTRTIKETLVPPTDYRYPHMA